MKKYFYSILILCLMLNKSMAQLDKNRTTATRIADLLAQVPAENASALNKNMEEIAELGKPGIVQIASMLTAPGKGEPSTASTRRHPCSPSAPLTRAGWTW